MSYVWTQLGVVTQFLQWLRNHEYNVLLRKGLLILLSEYGFKVQIRFWEGVRHPKSPNPKGGFLLLCLMSYSILYLYSHTIMASIIPKPNHSSIIAYILTYIYHGISYQPSIHLASCHHITSKVEVCEHYIKTETQAQKNSSKQTCSYIFLNIHHACSCECMTYLTYLAASQHLWH